ncbi:MAG: hypothetical protein JWO67_4518 [Streptosporangiaceae bacterium]|nr:hypothetical protein [Streptosporangiaceae bacterium]
MSEAQWVAEAREGLPAPPHSTFLGRTVDNVAVYAVEGLHPGTGEQLAALEVGSLVINLRNMSPALIRALKCALVGDVQ